MQYPIDCDTPRRRTEFCYACQEKLRWLHNAMWYWLNTDVTQVQWGKLPLRIRNRYVYKPRLTRQEWEDYRDNIEQKIDERIVTGILQNRAWLKISNKWSIDIGEI